MTEPVLRPTGRVAQRTDLVIRLDDNPRYRGSVHEDSTARAMGFRAALVPGAFLYGHISRLALEAWGMAWIERGAMTSRFRKPVYNGDAVVLLAADPVETDGLVTVEVAMHGPDGEVCSGSVALPSAMPTPPSPADWPMLPVPEARRPIAAGGMTPGLRGSTANAVLTQADIRESLSAFDERHPVYAQTGIAHSGCLMRLAMREVNSAFQFPSPVVLTACDTQHFAPVRAGARLAVSSMVAEEYERRGRRFFVSDEVLVADGAVAARFRRTQVYANG